MTIDDDLFGAASQLQARYCRAMDSHDAELLGSCVTDDVSLLAADGTTCSSRVALVDFFVGVWQRQTVPTTHLVQNLEVYQDAARIDVLATFMALGSGPSGLQVAWGRYTDQVAVCDDGQLRLLRKHITILGRTS